MSQPPGEYDSPVKEAIIRWLRSFLNICFPEIAVLVDWSKPPVFMDKELQKIIRGAAAGGQRADILVKLFLLDGSEECFLVHMEYQRQRRSDTPAKVFRYNNGFFEAYGLPVSSLVLLADNDPNWRPSRYERTSPGTRLVFEFPTCKLLDLAKDPEKLLATRELAALIILASAAAHQTEGNPAERKRWKWELTTWPYEANFEESEVLELYRILDWMLWLPEEQESQFRRELEEYEERKTMRYVTSIERFGRQEGLAEGQLTTLKESVCDILDARFGEVAFVAHEKVFATEDAAQLKSWRRLAATCESLEAFQKVLGL